MVTPTSSSGSASSAAGIQRHLQAALEEVERRDQVQRCLQDMIVNVEWAHQCNQQVETQAAKTALKKALQQQTLIVEETALVQETNTLHKHQLADALVQELFSVSQSLGEYQQLQQAHKELSQNYDALVAKLLQAEERIEMMQQTDQPPQSQRNPSQTTSENNSTQEQPNKANDETISAEKGTTGEEKESEQPTESVLPTSLEDATTLAAPPVPDLSSTDEVVDTTIPPLVLPKAAEAAAIEIATASSAPSNKEAVEDEDKNASPEDEPSLDDLAAELEEDNDKWFDGEDDDVEATEDLKPQSEGENTKAEPNQSTHENQPAAAADETSTEVPQAPTTKVASTTAASSSQAPVPAAAAAVVELDQNQDEDPPRLETLDTPALMHVFAYLDALDILNTAQVNISMYSRVDSLFGFGAGAEEDAPSVDNSTIATYESGPGAGGASSTAVVSQPTDQQQPTPQQQEANKKPPSSTNNTTATVVQLPPPAAASVASTAATTAATSSGTTARLPPPLPSTPKQGSISATTTAARTPQQQGGIFGFLQPRKSPNQGSLGSSPIPTFGNSPSQRRSPRPSSEPAPMNATMANSMASKLSDAELNAIIQMTERLRTKEAQLEQLYTEKERLLAQLDGIDAVKQFLVAKVRSMEESLRTTEDQEAKVAQQIASDQEVIAFLDGRVQELEQSLEKSKEDIEGLKVEWQAYQTQAEQKNTVLTDMLRFERERVQESQSEFKATKKLLIKEVKSCRAQIMALTAENRAISQENETLKRALLQTNNAGDPPSPKHSSYSYNKSSVPAS